MIRRYVLKDRVPVPADLMEWGEFMEKDEERRVGKTMIGDAEVSTVFFGLDMRHGIEGPPLLYETMIFGGEHDGDCWRYSTWEEAEAGHKKAVELVNGK